MKTATNEQLEAALDKHLSLVSERNRPYLSAPIELHTGEVVTLAEYFHRCEVTTPLPESHKAELREARARLKNQREVAPQCSTRLS